MNADDPKFTAHVLGENEDLTPDEQAEIEALLLSDPAAAAEAAQTRALAERLRLELQGETAPALEEKQRAAVIDAAANARKVVPFRRRANVLTAIAACLVVGISAVFLLPRITVHRKDGAVAVSTLKLPEPAPDGMLGRKPTAEEPFAAKPPLPSQLAPAESPGAQAATLPGANSFPDSRTVADRVTASTASPARAEPADGKDAPSTKKSEEERTQSRFDNLAVLSRKALPAPPAAQFTENKSAPRAAVAGNVFSDNPFVAASDVPVSTVSIDSDSTNYAVVRHFIDDHRRPPADAVRIEALLNHFAFEDAAPQGDASLAATMEVAACPWAPEHRLVRIGLKGREAVRNARIQVAFNPAQVGEYRLIGYENRSTDVAEFDDQRSAEEKMAEVGSATVLYEVAPTRERGRLYAALDHLEKQPKLKVHRAAETKSEAAAVPSAAAAPSGAATASPPSEPEPAAAAKSLPAPTAPAPSVRKMPTGVGQGAKVTPPAQDQPQFPPEHFPRPPTGPEPAPHDAVPELLPSAGPAPATLPAPKIEPSKDVKAYLLEKAQRTAGTAEDATKAAPAAATAASARVPFASKAIPQELLTLKVTYLPPHREATEQLVYPLQDKGNRWEESSADFRFAAAVAGYGMLLRDSPDRGQATWESVEEWAREGLGSDPTGYRHEFLDLIEKTKALAP